MKIETSFTRLLGCDLPIVVAPMFLVSDVGMVVAGSEAGAVGSFPALNVRPIEKLRDWLQEVEHRTARSFAVNLIVNRTNVYFPRQMEICLEEGVPMIIASLGNPAALITKAHETGTKVFCDVIHPQHAQKAIDAGADGLIAVTAGAGGHGGSISSFVLVPYLKQKFQVPVLVAGGVADGRGLAAALLVGADGVSMGTRFIASQECPVAPAYKQAILAAQPQDIVTTYKLDGVAANVIDTPYVRKIGMQLSWPERLLFRSHRLRPMMMAYRTLRSLPTLKNAIQRPTWKQLWAAGQVAGLVEDIPTIQEILARMVREYEEAIQSMPVPKTKSLPAERARELPDFDGAPK